MAFPEVTLERVQQWAQSNELQTDVDDDGDLRVGFEEITMYVHVRPGMLRVQGYWRKTFNPEEELRAVTDVVNEFNANSLLPKAMIVVERGYIVLEHTCTTEKGMNDAQLANVLNSAFAGSFSAIESFEEKLSNQKTQGEK